MPGTFIDITIDPTAATDPDLAHRLKEVCPVDIFTTTTNGHTQIVQDNLDECVLCQLCINTAPPGTIHITKLYSGQTLPARR